MIWWLTKLNHEVCIHPLARRWLRLGGLGKLFIVIGVSILPGMILGFETERFFPASNPVNIFMITVFGFILLWIVEVIVDFAGTRSDLDDLSADGVLSTRGEYIGGHPHLPHGRFVYLTLSGTRENPQLEVVLLQASRSQPVLVFSIPLLDVQEASERRELTNADLAMGQAMANSLANVSFRSKGMRQQAFLNVNYVGAGGRKHVVEFGNFLFGDEEIQNWRNYIVCIQAEADTGEQPYGPWNSLPEEDEQADEGTNQEQGGENLLDPSLEGSDRIKG